MYGIALYCKDTLGGVVVVGLCDSNTNPGYTTLLRSALDCGNMYGIALDCKDTHGGGNFPIVIPIQVKQLYFAISGFWEYVWNSSIL